MKKFCPTNADRGQDRMVNARVYAAQIIADNLIFVAEEEYCTVEIPTQVEFIGTFQK